MTTLGYAILGLLSRERLSGYDLTRGMRGRVGNFWSAKHSQIYPELARLEEKGHVTHGVVEQRGRPDKKVYEITTEGLRELKEWVPQPPVERPTREELVVKVYSAWLADPDATLELFREQERHHEERLARYQEIEKWMEREWGEDLGRPDSPRFASYAALRRGLIHERGYAEWCHWLAGALERRKDGRGELP